MEPLKFPCNHTAAGSTWTEEPPSSIHRHKVTCSLCGRHLKWGTDAELHYRVKAHDKITVVNFEEPPREPSVEDFMVGDDDE